MDRNVVYIAPWCLTKPRGLHLFLVLIKSFLCESPPHILLL
uniref:Uncharacterized protein n=1 Tax=Anguilla anguilla TaxID=7936 RepID=A0A0E9VJ24_ANGAN